MQPPPAAVPVAPVVHVAKVAQNAQGAEERLSARSAESAMAASEQPMVSALIPIEKIVPDPANPRQEFSQAEIEELADSIKKNGLVQPVVVLPDGNGVFRLLVGERRLRAAALAGLSVVPALVRRRELTQAESLELRLLENTSRQDLAPLHLAKGLQKLMVLRDCTASELAKAVGMSASSVTRSLALLRLPECLQKAVEEKTVAPAVAYEVSKVGCEKERVLLAVRTIEQQLTRDQVAAQVDRLNAKPAKNAESAGGNTGGSAGGNTGNAKKAKSQSLEGAKEKFGKKRWLSPEGVQLQIAAPKGETLDGERLISALESVLKQCRQAKSKGLPVASWIESGVCAGAKSRPQDAGGNQEAAGLLNAKGDPRC